MNCKTDLHDFCAKISPRQQKITYILKGRLDSVLAKSEYLHRMNSERAKELIQGVLAVMLRANELS